MKINKCCPFCGSNDLEVTQLLVAGVSKALYHVSCNNCSATGGSYDSEKGAISKWNTRVSQNSDLDLMKSMCNLSEFSGTYTEKDGSMYYSFSDEPIDTKELEFKDEKGSNVILTAVFHRGTEDFLGFLTKHECTCHKG